MDVATQIVRCANCGAKNRVAFGVEPERQPVCGRCKNPLSFSFAPLTITDENFAAEVENSPLPVLIDFWAEWCGPCRMIAPTIEALAKEIGGQVRIGKLDVDNNPRTSLRFQVRSIPILIVFENGREVDRMIGLQSKEAILQRLNRFLV
jgi:thioredoxin